MLVVGLVRPVAIAGNPSKGGWVGYGLTYVGALVMVIALAVAANYIGSEEAVESVRFFAAIFILAVLTLMVIVLTAAAAIVSAQVGSRLMSQGSYQRSLTITITTSFFGLCLGGLAGFGLATLG